MVCNDHSNTSSIFTSIWFYAILPNVPFSFPPVPLKKLFPDINDDFFYTCILGFFCGCPLGAKIINDLILSGSYTKQEGQALLYVCNQISPMFTIGYTLTLILHGNINTLCFFFCLYFPVLCYLFYLFYLFFTKDFLHAHQISHPVSIKKSADQII